MKKKMAVLIGIAICAMLLASPVLASAGYSKIYGNANEDDVLDMRDVTYIKLVIFGKKPATTFADANYDGKISMLDIGQTKLIILGKEKILTLVDQADRVVTVPRPIERIVTPSHDAVRAIVALGEVDKLVGVPSKSGCSFTRYETLLAGKAYPQLKELPDVGVFDNVNMEGILALKPDVLFAYAGGTYTDVADTIQENTGIPTVCVGGGGTWGDLHVLEIYRLVGTVIGKEKAAEELILYAHEEIAKVAEITSEIPEDEKPKVYLAFWSYGGTITRTPTGYEPVDLAGGINVAKGAGFEGYSGEVPKEQIIAWNPDIIMLGSCLPHGEPGDLTIEDVLSDSDLQTINAVKNCKIYYTKAYACGWDPATGLTETVYFAKLFHPEQFDDLDVKEEGNEIYKRFYGVNDLFTWVSSYYEYELHPKPWK